MKTRIIYFSQSGSTLSIAEDIAEGIREAGDACELTDLTATDPSAATDCDLLGIGCPVFYYKEPFNVADFMDALPSGDGKPAFVFITHGSVPGGTLASMWQRLADKGYAVLGVHNAYADNNQVPIYPHPTYTTGHPDKQDHDEARAFGRRMADTGRRVRAGETGLVPEPIAPPEGWWTEEAVMLSREALAQAFPPLSINADTCIQCQACEQACPVNGIDVLADPPRIQDPCIYCYNCVKACPELAIEAPWEAVAPMVPGFFQRYRQTLEEAEQRGEFRWLVDPDSIDLDDPVYKQRERNKK